MPFLTITNNADAVASVTDPDGGSGFVLTLNPGQTRSGVVVSTDLLSRLSDVLDAQAELGNITWSYALENTARHITMRATPRRTAAAISKKLARQVNLACARPAAAAPSETRHLAPKAHFGLISKPPTGELPPLSEIDRLHRWTVGPAGPAGPPGAPGASAVGADHPHLTITDDPAGTTVTVRADFGDGHPTIVTITPGSITINNVDADLAVRVRSIALVDGADQHMVRGEALRTWLMNHSHGTPAGPSSTPSQAWVDSVLSQFGMLK